MNALLLTALCKHQQSFINDSTVLFQTDADPHAKVQCAFTSVLNFMADTRCDLWCNYYIQGIVQPKTYSTRHDTRLFRRKRYYVLWTCILVTNVLITCGLL